MFFLLIINPYEYLYVYIFKRQSFDDQPKVEVYFDYCQQWSKKGGDFRNTQLPIFAVCVIFVGLFNLNETIIIKSLLNERCIYSDNSCAYLGKET